MADQIQKQVTEIEWEREGERVTAVANRTAFPWSSRENFGTQAENRWMQNKESQWEESMRRRHSKWSCQIPTWKPPFCWGRCFFLYSSLAAEILLQSTAYTSPLPILRSSQKKRSKHFSYFLISLLYQLLLVLLLLINQLFKTKVRHLHLKIWTMTNSVMYSSTMSTHKTKTNTKNYNHPIFVFTTNPSPYKYILYCHLSENSPNKIMLLNLYKQTRFSFRCHHHASTLFFWSVSPQQTSDSILLPILLFYYLCLNYSIGYCTIPTYTFVLLFYL